METPRFTPRSAQEWGAVAPQWVGIGGLIFCTVVWLFSARIEPLLLSAFGGLIFVGQAGEAVATLRRTGPPPVTAIDEATENGA